MEHINRKPIVLLLALTLSIQCFSQIGFQKTFWNTDTITNHYGYSCRLTTLIFYNCSINKFDKVYNCSVYYLKTINDVNGECGCVNNALFNVNIEFFTESIHFNSCLNRKIAIDRLKNVKNCLSMKHTYGKLSEGMLENLIISNEFTKFWHINKDKVTICKDCEFRYFCHDCRAFTINPNDLFSKPLKCGYDPYTNKWTDWKK